MSFLFGGSGPTSAQKIEAAQTELEMITDMFNRLQQSCTRKCIPNDYREGDLNKGESVCLDRCVGKFFEINVKVRVECSWRGSLRERGIGAADEVHGRRGGEESGREDRADERDRSPSTCRTFSRRRWVVVLPRALSVSASKRWNGRVELTGDWEGMIHTTEGDRNVGGEWSWTLYDMVIFCDPGMEFRKMEIFEATQESCRKVEHELRGKRMSCRAVYPLIVWSDWARANHFHGNSLSA